MQTFLVNGAKLAIQGSLPGEGFSHTSGETKTNANRVAGDKNTTANITTGN